MVLSSFVYCLIQDSTSKAFYFPFCRFWELGAGVLLAYAEHFKFFVRCNRSATMLDQVASWIGIFLIVAAYCFLSDESPFPGWVSMMPVMGAVLIICSSPEAFVNRILSIRLVVFVGLISYSLYLWHWPFLSYLSIVVPQHTATDSALALIASSAMAFLVYVFIENPARRVKSFNQMRRLDIGLLFCLLVLFCAGQVVRMNDGFSDRKINEQFERPEKLTTSVRLQDLPVVNVNGVEVRVNNAEKFPEILFIGDSHMRQYFARILLLAKEKDVTVGFATSGGCLALPGVEPLRKTCANTIKVYDTLLSSKIKRFVLFDRWGAYMGEEKENFWRNRDGLDAALARLRDKLVSSKVESSRFFVGLDNPWGDDFDVKRHLKNRFYINNDSFDVSVPLPQYGLWMEGNAVVERELKGFVTIIDGTSQICPNHVCDLKRYDDSNHLRETYTEKNAVWIDQIFDGL